jgi:hypothetical protein
VTKWIYLAASKAFEAVVAEFARVLGARRPLTDRVPLGDTKDSVWEVDPDGKVNVLLDGQPVLEDLKTIGATAKQIQAVQAKVEKLDYDQDGNVRWHFLNLPALTPDDLITNGGCRGFGAK